MSRLWQDVRYALRALAKRPALTWVALFSLALGIGANTAIFSLLNAVLLRPLPVPHPEQLVSLTTTISDALNDDDAFSWPLFEELSRNQQVFSDVFIWDGGGMNNFEVDDVHYSASLANVSGTYYKGIQTTPLLGRYINESDAGSAVAVVSYRAWRNWFHGASNILGRAIHVGSRVYTVIGVAPANFSGLRIDAGDDVTVPLFAPGSVIDQGPYHLRYPVYARLKPGVTLAQARAGLTGLWPRILKASVPPDYAGEKESRFLARTLKLESAANGLSFMRRRFSRPLQILMALVGTVLVIACLNMANLSLFKAAVQRHQYGVKAVLGATVWDLLRPPLIESLLLSSGGAALGLLLAYWASRVIIGIAWTGLVQSSLSVAPDLRVLIFTAAVTLIAGLLFGIVPALYAARVDPIDALKSNARSISGGANVFGKLLLVTQIALSLVLLVAALLFGRSLSSLHSADAGYQRDHVLTVQLFPQAGSKLSGTPLAYYRQLAQRVQNIPGVQAVSYSWSAPASQFESRSPVFGSLAKSSVPAVWESVAPGFFSVVGMHFISGNDVSWTQAGRATPPAVISQSLAEKLFGNSNAIGRTVFLGAHAHARPLTVVGVVNSASLWKVESVRPMAVYALFEPQADNDEPLMDVKTNVDPLVLKASIEQAIRSLGHHYSLRTATVDQRLDSLITVQRLTAILASCFGGVALLISCVGLYGLMSFHVARRTSELGIRSALGARHTQLLSMVLREALLLSGAGCVVGMLVSLVGGRAIGSLLFGVSPTDPVLLSLAAAAMLSVAAAASFLPARRAAYTNPLTALRAD